MWPRPVHPLWGRLAMHSVRLPAGSLTGIGLPRMIVQPPLSCPGRADCVIAFSTGHFYNAFHCGAGSAGCSDRHLPVYPFLTPP